MARRVFGSFHCSNVLELLKQPTGKYRAPTRPFPLPSDDPGSLGLAPSGRS